MRISFYGRLRDVAGADEIDVAVPTDIGDSAALRAWLGQTYPALLEAKVRMLIDDLVIQSPSAITGGESIAFLPAVSGG